MSALAVALAGQAGVSRERATLGESARGTTVAWLGTCLLVLAAPFEAQAPLVRLPGQSLSTVETALLVVLAAWLAACVSVRTVPEWRTPLTMPAIAFGLCALAAALASAHRANAVHMTGRFALAFVVYLMVVNGVTTAARLRGVAATAAAAGAIVALLVILEYAGVPAVLAWLRHFRADVAHVGAQVRAGGPLQYPTIASMYLEIVFVLTLGLWLNAIDAKRRAVAVGMAALLIAIAEAVTLTFTRAGTITMGASLALVGALRFRRRGVDPGLLALAGLAVVVALQFLSSPSVGSLLRLRLTTEGQNAWFHATIDAPPYVSIPTGGASIIPVTLTNSGDSSWDPRAVNRFRLSYHWLLPDEDRVVSWEGERTDFPQVVRPGDSVTLQARVVAPRQPGAYRLMWDVEQEHQLWFSTEPDAEIFFSLATVSGAASAGALDRSRLSMLPKQAVRPGRLVLWTAASRMFAAHPLLGVGPDNFRLLYGTYAQLPDADPRVHSNNMYLEVLTGGGIVMAAAFLWICWSAAQCTVPLVRQVSERDAALTSSVAVAAAAMALHGLVDSFLSFTATYLLMAITLGLVVAGNRFRGGSDWTMAAPSAVPLPFGTGHAHRV